MLLLSQKCIFSNEILVLFNIFYLIFCFLFLADYFCTISVRLRQPVLNQHSPKTFIPLSTISEEKFYLSKIIWLCVHIGFYVSLCFIRVCSIALWIDDAIFLCLFSFSSPIGQFTDSIRNTIRNTQILVCMRFFL